MKIRLLQYLACPACQEANFALEVKHKEQHTIYHSHFTGLERGLDGLRFEDREEEDIEEGVLHCNNCGQHYPILKGIPRMLLDRQEEDSVSQAQSGHRFTRFDPAQDLSVWETHFLELNDPLRKEDFIGKRVLDLGCGYGRHSYFAARYGAEVIAIDSSEDAVLATKENTKNLKHVHIIQADGAHLPLREQSIDRGYCFGVLHHVKNSAEILASINRVISSGGSLSIWVYGPRQGLTLAVNNALRGVTTNMNHEELLSLSQNIARGLRVVSHTPYLVLHKVPVVKGIVSHLPVHDHYRWPFDIVVADVYDRLKFPIYSWFKKEELEKWYIDHGYLKFAARRIVRNNETFSAFGVKR